MFTDYTNEQLIEFARSYTPKGKTDLTHLIYLEADKRGIDFSELEPTVSYSAGAINSSIEPIMGVGKTRSIDSLCISKQNQRKEPMTISFFEVAKWLESQRLRGLKKNKIYKNKSARF